MRTLHRSRPLLLTFALLALGGAPSASASTGCASADALPPRASASALANATICLVNQERTRRGLRALRVNNRLSQAAVAHANDMVARGYFSHETAGGGSFVDRIVRTGYVPGNAFPSLGEDLAWGSGPLGSARAIVRGWMNSPGHRANILNRRFREAGIGIAFGAPGGGLGGGGATYALEFGSGGRQ
jgi:uncharacterized protein YkwD